MAIFRYQTLTLAIEVNKSALTDISEVAVSLGQPDRVAHFFLSQENLTVDPENGLITVFLTQADTAWLKPNRSCHLQINIKYNNGDRRVSPDVLIDDVYDNLFNEVID